MTRIELPLADSSEQLQSHEGIEPNGRAEKVYDMKATFNRAAFSYEDISRVVPVDGKRILDFGCGDGAFLKRLSPANQLFGCDVDPDRIAEARQLVPDAAFTLVGLCPSLQFADDAFDVVTLMNTLEHVPDEIGLLVELQRVLKPGGIFVVLVPHRSIFEVFDVGNVKFRFPRLHKLIHLAFSRTSREKYGRKFEANKNSTGCIGCHTNRWHKHYTAAELSQMLSPWFEVDRQYGFCAFNHILMIAHGACTLVCKNAETIVLRGLNRLIALDYRIQPPPMFANYILITATKKGRSAE